jgi:hypothetical protein
MRLSILIPGFLFITDGNDYKKNKMSTDRESGVLFVDGPLADICLQASQIENRKLKTVYDDHGCCLLDWAF